MALSDYSSHDWRKNTDDAVVMDNKNKTYAKVNDCKVKFIDPTKSGKPQIIESQL